MMTESTRFTHDELEAELDECVTGIPSRAKLQDALRAVTADNDWLNLGLIRWCVAEGRDYQSFRMELVKLGAKKIV